MPQNDKDALRAWYAANYQPADAPAPPTPPPPPDTRTPVDTEPVTVPAAPDQMQELPSVTPQLLSELRQRKAAADSNRVVSQPSPAAQADLLAAREQRRKDAEITRTRAQKKSLRRNLFWFLALVAGTIAGLIAIYWIIQTKFDGQIPSYFH